MYRRVVPGQDEMEAIWQGKLAEKLRALAAICVTGVRAAEQQCGTSVLEAMREALLARHAPAPEGGTLAAVESLRRYVEALEEGCRGSHQWTRKVSAAGDRHAFTFTGCLWAEIFRDLGAHDVGYWICEGDGPAVRRYDPRIRFRRTRTLMLGDPVCDHVYWVESEAQVPED